MTKMHLKRKEREAKQQDGTASKIDLDWVVCHPIFLFDRRPKLGKNTISILKIERLSMSSMV